MKKKATYNRNDNIHSYKVKAKSGKLEEYSGKFKTVAKAKEWYNKHGVVLESMFNRKLILT